MTGLTIAKGTRATVQAKLKLVDGAVLEDGVVEYVHGTGNLLPGVEAILTGLAKGEERSGVLKAGDALAGNNQPTRAIPRAEFPGGVRIEVGEQFTAKEPGGKDVVLRILSATNETVSVRLVHPLEGKAIEYELTVLSVMPPLPTAERKQALVRTSATSGRRVAATDRRSGVSKMLLYSAVAAVAVTAAAVSITIAVVRRDDGPVPQQQLDATQLAKDAEREKQRAERWERQQREKALARVHSAANRMAGSNKDLVGGPEVAYRELKKSVKDVVELGLESHVSRYVEANRELDLVVAQIAELDRVDSWPSAKEPTKPTKERTKPYEKPEYDGVFRLSGTYRGQFDGGGIVVSRGDRYYVVQDAEPPTWSRVSGYVENVGSTLLDIGDGRYADVVRLSDRQAYREDKAAYRERVAEAKAAHRERVAEAKAEYREAMTQYKLDLASWRRRSRQEREVRAKNKSERPKLERRRAKLLQDLPRVYSEMNID